MGAVYACICPPEVPPEAERSAAAAGQIASELSAYRPELAVVIAGRGDTLDTTIGLGAGEGVGGELSERIREEALRDDVPLGAERGAGGAPLGLACARLTIKTSELSARRHFQLGQAVARALEGLEARTAVVCEATLSRAHGPGEAGAAFDRRCRRAVEEWDAKWVVGVEGEARRRAKEGCVGQLAVLMGALGLLRIQARVVSYEVSGGAGLLVAAIDVLGARRR